jgi:hypothetical protein
VTPFQQYQLLHMQAEVQALVSEREAMIAANKGRESAGLSLAYGEDAFAMNAQALRCVVPDPRELA